MMVLGGYWQPRFLLAVRTHLDPIPDVVLAAIHGHNHHHDDPEQDLECRRINVQAVEEQRELGEDQRPENCSPLVSAPPLEGRSAQHDADDRLEQKWVSHCHRTLIREAGEHDASDRRED